MNLDELLKYCEMRLKYYTDELNNLVNLDFSIFGVEQKEIHHKMTMKTKEQIEITSETIRYLQKLKNKERD